MPSRDPAREQANANKDVVSAASGEWTAGTGRPFAMLADDASWRIVGNSPVAVNGGRIMI